MSQLTVAAKANNAFLLPTLLAINYVKQTLPGTDVTVVFEDVESIASQGAKLELKTDDGKTIYDDDILKHLENIYEPLQAGDKEQVCANTHIFCSMRKFLLPSNFANHNLFFLSFSRNLGR